MKKRNRIGKAGTAAALLLCLLLLLPMGAGAAEEGVYFPACGEGYTSLVDALKSVGAESSFDFRAEIAACNGYRDYRGTAGQNRALLWLLRNGALRRPAGTTPPEANQGGVAFLRQEPKTCKATAVAMALNLLQGADKYGTADLGGSCCRGLDGETYTGSDGHTYRAVYKTDGYEGSLGELTGAIDDALAAGLPIVAAVHSLRGGTRHHWVLILGRSGGDWLIADPARAGSGSIADNAVTLSSRGYALGLADYETMHYGYVTFLPA